MAHKVGLVIGNSGYSFARLPNAKEDARAVGELLSDLGYQVSFEYDLKKQALENALTRLIGTTVGSDAAVCFYAGHAFQIAGSVYMVPLDWVSGSTDGLVPMGRLIGSMSNSKTRVVIMDACRNNPLQNAGNLGRSTLPIGALGSTVMFSTRAGGKSYDGTGSHSPFTESLLQHMSKPDLELVDIYRAIASDLSGKQTPEVWISQPDPFYFSNA